MKAICKLFIFVLTLTILPTLTECGDAALLQAATINVSGPSQVAVGEQFQIRYTVNTTDVKGFRMGNVPDAFDVLAGPYTSTQQSISIVNGSTTHTSSITYTYVLMANKNGSFVIPAAHASVSGSNAVSQALKITVSGKMPQQQGGGYQQQQRPQQRVDRAGSRISGNDLFIRVTANKQKVYEQEPILLTYKVYTQVELTQLEGKMPDLNGFHTQEIPLPQQKSFHVENVNGRPYNCVTWSQYVMFPQLSGKLEIPALTFKGIVVQENPNVDPFEAFFNGGSGYIEVKKEIKAPAVQIQVVPLPTRPAGFSGGVGKFTVSASLDKNKVKAGDPVTLRFEVKGTGNMKLIKEPMLELPKDFEKYDAKVTDNTKLTPDGVTGSMVYDILIVPRNKGKYTIPAMNFVYFDTQSATYKTLTTNAMELEVEKGNGHGGAVMDYSQRNDNDISDIIMGELVRENPQTWFFGSTSYLIINIIAVTIFLTLLIIFRRRAMEMANIAAMRGKKANKVAGKRLKKAARLMKDGKGNEFYDEVLHALWGYVGDKLAMPVEQLSRDNIQQALLSRNVDETVIQSFIEAIDECEFARYAPGDASGNMHKTYDKAVEAITNIEDNMKKKSAGQKGAALKVMLLGVIMLSLGTVPSLAANAETAYKANADAAYRSADYQKAIELYCKDLKEGPSAATYHNLGNCYFRTDDIPHAVLFYEKALVMEPTNDAIKHSLMIARAKTADKLPAEPVFFITYALDAVYSMMSVDDWAMLALCSLIVSLLLFLAYLFVDNLNVKRCSFYASVLLLIVFLVGNLSAWQRSRNITRHDTAIVMAKSVNVKSSPVANSADACIIHEGTWLRITDKDMKGWYGIRLADGREGWIKTSEVEEI